MARKKIIREKTISAKIYLLNKEIEALSKRPCTNPGVNEWLLLARRRVYDAYQAYYKIPNIKEIMQ